MSYNYIHSVWIEIIPRLKKNVLAIVKLDITDLTGIRNCIKNVMTNMQKKKYEMYWYIQIQFSSPKTTLLYVCKIRKYNSSPAAFWYRIMNPLFFVLKIIVYSQS